MELEQKILEKIKELREVTQKHVDWTEKWTDADNAYRQTKANQFLQAEGKTIPEKEAKVDLICSEERAEAHVAQAMMRATKEARRSIDAELACYRALLKANQ